MSAESTQANDQARSLNEDRKKDKSCAPEARQVSHTLTPVTITLHFRNQSTLLKEKAGNARTGKKVSE